MQIEFQQLFFTEITANSKANGLSSSDQPISEFHSFYYRYNFFWCQTLYRLLCLVYTSNETKSRETVYAWINNRILNCENNLQLLDFRFTPDTGKLMNI